jgi:hypothetical protein
MELTTTVKIYSTGPRLLAKSVIDELKKKFYNVDTRSRRPLARNRKRTRCQISTIFGLREEGR